MCPFFHPGEEYLIGKVFWRRAAAAKPGVLSKPPAAGGGAAGGGAAGGGAAAPAKPPVLPLLSPPTSAIGHLLSDPRVLFPVSEFLTGAEKLTMRQVSKEMKESLDTIICPDFACINPYMLRRRPPPSFITRAKMLKIKGYIDGYIERDGPMRLINDRLALRYFCDAAGPHTLILVLDTDMEDIERMLSHFERVSILMIYGPSTGMGTDTNRVRQIITTLGELGGAPFAKNLRKIRIQHMFLSNTAMSIIWNTLARLKVATLDVTVSHHDLIRPPATPIPSLRSFRLTVERNMDVGYTVGTLQERFAAYFNLLSSFPYLQNFKFVPYNLQLTGVSLAGFPKQPNIKKLNISMGWLTPVRRDELFALFSNVETLMLGPSPRGPLLTADESTWFNVGKAFPKLKVLGLGSMILDVADNPVDLLATCPPTLEQVFLHGKNIIRHQNAAAIFKKFPNLWSLGLNGNSVSGTGNDVVRLAESLAESCPNLEELGFTMSLLTADEATRCCTAFAGLKRLQRLFMYDNTTYSGTALYPADLRALRPTLPHAAIIRRPDQGGHRKVRAYR
jgi:hypothetical protein